MSWSVSTPIVSIERLDGEICVLQVPPYFATAADSVVNNAIVPPEAVDQLEAAKTAARDIIASGAVGKEGYYVVRLSGHAAPGHLAPTDRYSFVEAVSVYIQRTLPPEPVIGDEQTNG